jgi:hypothetical protein
MVTIQSQPEDKREQWGDETRISFREMLHTARQIEVLAKEVGHPDMTLGLKDFDERWFEACGAIAARIWFDEIHDKIRDDWGERIRWGLWRMRRIIGELQIHAGMVDNPELTRLVKMLHDSWCDAANAMGKRMMFNGILDEECDPKP